MVTMADKVQSKVKDKGLKNAEKQAKPAKPARVESDDSDIDNEEEGGSHIGGVYIPPPPIAVCSGENRGPRLIITHIVNLNFKSYAGRQVLGPFHKNFTSIIGPNGSGKSNVIDSMLFVFGYRATKIRSKKLSVLIHNSEQHRNVRSCTVEVHFVQILDKGPGDFEEIPNSKIVISRSANVDNQSQYTINGKNARFKEVALLLRSHGIDLVHNRFLILQGEVEQIAMMKPKALTEHETGMLEYLEDIVGTTRYKAPLLKLEAKLEELNTEKAEKSARFKATEKEKTSLNEPLKEAVEFLKEENEHIRVKNKMHQWHLNEWNKKLKEASTEKTSLENTFKEIEVKMKQIQETLAVKEKEISAKNKELESIRTKREHLKESLAKFEKQSTELKLDIGHSNQKRKKAMETKKQLEEKLITMKNIPEKNTKEINDLKKVEEKLIQARNEEEALVEKTLASLQLETQELQDNLNRLNNKLIGLNKIKNDANAKYEVAKTELDVYQNKEIKEKDKLEKMKSALVDVNNRLKEEQTKLSEASANLPGAQEELSKSEAELAQVRQSEFTVRQEINNLMGKIQEKRNLMQDTRSRGRVLDYMMKQKEVPGVFGRLGDLGGIDAKYDCAISTACGFLDHIVTDSSKTSGKCIELLKKYDLGRGSFIGLKEQERLIEQCNRPIKTPENIPRLFDLIKINDERLKPAFYFALRDTLVANDLAQAKRCAYGAVRHRVVTLTGEIIEVSGTMSGGGREKRTGRMGRSASVVTDSGSAEDLNLLEQQISDQRGRLQNIEQRRVTLETNISNLNNNIKKWKMNLSACEVHIKEFQRQEHQLNQQIKNQESVVGAAAVNPEIVEDMTTRLNKLKEEFDIAAKNSGEVQAEVKKVKSSIDAATGGKMKEVRQKLQKTVTKLNKVTAEITKLGVEIKATARDEVKAKNRVTSLAAEIAENESSILKAEELHNALLEKVEKTTEEFEKINKNVTELDKELKEMRSETSGHHKELSTLKASKLNENQKMESIEKNIKESELGIDHRTKQLNKLVLNEIPVFGDEEQENQQEQPDNKLKTYTPEEIEEFEYNGLKYLDIQQSEKITQLRSKVNLNVVEVYREKSAELKTRLEELEAVINVRNEVRQGYDEVRKARLHEFMTGFTIITNKLKEMYQMITLGGDAEFELVDNLDPFSEGVLFSVRPPKKSWKNISNLSGGEKTLSSLALVFALHYYKPSPLYVMDEIDAALDFKNVSIVATYIKERTKNAQFIIISLRSNMFELADLLVGIYKTYNCTKSVTVTPNLYLTNCTNNNHKINNVTVNNKDETENVLSPLAKRAKMN